MLHVLQPSARRRFLWHDYSGLSHNCTLNLLLSFRLIPVCLDLTRFPRPRAHISLSHASSTTNSAATFPSSLPLRSERPGLSENAFVFDRADDSVGEGLTDNVRYRTAEGKQKEEQTDAALEKKKVVVTFPRRLYFFLLDFYAPCDS